PVSYVGIFSRQCTLAGQPIHLAGIGSVMTPIAHRKRGYATTGLQAADAYIREAIRAPFAQLVTDQELIPFYGRFGWRQIHDPVLVELPDGTQTRYEGVVMILALDGTPWPGGTLDLRGKPW
ncbi:MAG: GNAT family N-acetyltransferase, partial [Anaerolineae bacterium]|nr:GNAT family N-acetyltransferase [Anaerolineae bacterium]